MPTPLRALHAPSIVRTKVQARASSFIADEDRAHPSRCSSVGNRQRHKPRRATVLVITRKGRESGEPVPVQVTSQTQRSVISISFARRMDRPWPARLYSPKQVAFVSPRHSRRYAYSTTSVARAVYRSYGGSGPCLLGHRRRGQRPFQSLLFSRQSPASQTPSCNSTGNNSEVQRIRRARSHPSFKSAV